MTEWMFCMFSNVTADVRCEEIKGKSCVCFMRIKAQNINSKQNMNPKVMTRSRPCNVIIGISDQPGGRSHCHEITFLTVQGNNRLREVRSDLTFAMLNEFPHEERTCRPPEGDPS